jgi:hypothetical protein
VLALEDGHCEEDHTAVQQRKHGDEDQISAVFGRVHRAPTAVGVAPVAVRLSIESKKGRHDVGNHEACPYQVLRMPVAVVVLVPQALHLL